MLNRKDMTDFRLGSKDLFWYVLTEDLKEKIAFNSTRRGLYFETITVMLFF